MKGDKWFEGGKCVYAMSEFATLEISYTHIAHSSAYSCGAIGIPWFVGNGGPRLVALCSYLSNMMEEMLENRPELSDPFLCVAG